jgi:hypothetical protein
MYEISNNHMSSAFFLISLLFGSGELFVPLVVHLSLAFCILINSSKTTGPIWTNLWWNGPWVVPFQNCVRQFPCQPRWLPLLKIENSAKYHLKIIFSETAGQIGPKLWWNGLQMVLFENYVWRPRPPTKMATVTKNRKFSKKSLRNYLLWNCWASGAQTILKWSLLVPFQNCVWWVHARLSPSADIVFT